VLTEMRIEGLGVIDEATLDLHPGLTVVTGETGAGKTMVVTGLQLLAGGRADASRVRHGADRAIVEGRFRPARGSPAADLASEVGARTDEDGSLIASRNCSSRLQSARSSGSSPFHTSCSPLRTIPPSWRVWYVPERTTRDRDPEPEISARHTASASFSRNGSVSGLSPDVSDARTV